MHHTVKATFVAVTVALLAAVCTGCGDDEETTPPAVPSPTEKTPTPTTTAPGTRAPAGQATVAVRSSNLGQVLVDGEGRTLYLFEADTSEKSTCNDACARAWPPLTTSGEPKAGEGVKADLLGMTTRDDGTTEVTYNGHPLYYYQGDEKPGDTTGQELDQFGAEWFVLNADGNKVEGDGEGEGEDQDGG
ncbi:COG4315 family predicted lipoprotein [Streptomyces sp. KR80]|uniref:COG4315 family predicted lipoprotein n=1 Tax=Streptomyces sp. KR80 TaxID=3457426 RepID=UPI003FD0A20D